MMVMKPAAISLLLLLTAPRAPSEDLRADLSVEMDKNSFTQAEDVSGTVTLTLHWAKDSPLRDRPTVLMNGPQVSLQVESSPRWGLIVDEFSPPLEHPVKVGQSYTLRFKISAVPGLKKHLAAAENHIASFAAGTYAIRARVTSLASHSEFRPEWVNADFLSDQKKFGVTAEVKKILSKEDLLRALEKADPTAKSDLVCYYESMGHPLRDLTFFERPKLPQSIVHQAPPMFLEVQPGEEVRCVTARPADDITRAGGLIQHEDASF